MSYDINLKTSQALDEDLARLGCEVHTQRGGYLICLTGDDASARQAWAGLVALAKSVGATLFDPQAGAEVDLLMPWTLPPMWGPMEGELPRAPSGNLGVSVRLYTVSVDEARQVYAEMFGGTVVSEAPDLIVIRLCGVLFSLRVKPRRRRARPDYVGEPAHRVRTDATVILLPPADYEQMAERVRQTGTAPFEFAFAPALRAVPGEAPAHCFVVRDGNENHIEFRRVDQG